MRDKYKQKVEETKDLIHSLQLAEKTVSVPSLRSSSCTRRSRGSRLRGSTLSRNMRRAWMMLTSRTSNYTRTTTP